MSSWIPSAFLKYSVASGPVFSEDAFAWYDCAVLVYS